MTFEIHGDEIDKKNAFQRNLLPLICAHLRGIYYGVNQCSSNCISTSAIDQKHMMEFVTTFVYFYRDISL